MKKERLVALFGLLMSFAASTLMYITHGGCLSCGRQELFFFSIPLSLAGGALYGIFLVFCWSHLQSRLYVITLSAILGIHLAIFTSFWRGHICIYCLLALVGTIVALCAAGMAGRMALIPLIVVTGGLALSSFAIHSTGWLTFNSPQLRQLGRTLDAETDFDPHFVNVVVFVSDTCGLCKMFREEYDPRLRRETAVPVRFFYRKSLSVTAYPTLFFVKRNRAPEIGLQPYERLLAEINGSDVALASSAH